MKINNPLQLSELNLKELQKIYKIFKQENKNCANLDKKINKNLLSKILMMIKSLDKPLQKMLITIWPKMKISLNEKNITKLVKYLNHTSLSLNDKRATIKAFAYLLKNDLPLKSPLINSVSNNLNPERSLTDILNNQGYKQKIHSKIKNNLILNIKQPAVEIFEDIKQYSHKLQEIIPLLENNSSSKTTELLKYLIGQQALNTNNDLLLTLEIPVQVAANRQIYPLHIQINKYNNSNKYIQKEIDNGFKISFIIQLAKDIIIKSNTLISGNNIYCHFLTDNNTLYTIIKNRIHILEKKLAGLDYNIKNLEIEKLPPCPENRIIKEKENFIDNILYANTGQNNQNIYTHIDIKM